VKPVLVIGSSNTDMVVTVDELPRPGQTVLGGDFQTFAGGKGANQAVAARRAGGEVCFVAALGADDLGRHAIASLSGEGIDVSRLQVLDGNASGVALIFVSRAGENCIAVAPGANSALSAGYLRENSDLFAAASIVLLQLETPLETVAAAVELASAVGTPCILNPAPAAAIPDSILSELFCITPNQGEAEILTGIEVTDLASATAAARALLQRGVDNVVITMGESGALLCNTDGAHHQAAERVAVVDTTGAGDTFNGVFAAKLASGNSIRDALASAVVAATLSVQSAGAIASVPRLGD
jgi:ribokinase